MKKLQLNKVGSLKRMRRFAHVFLTDDRGQSTTEYILILSVVVMVAMKFKSVFTGQLNNAVNTLGNGIDQVVSSDVSGQ